MIVQLRNESIYLVAKRLARPGRENDEGVLPSQDAIDGTPLFMAKVVVAEFLGEDLTCERQVWPIGVGCDSRESCVRLLALGRGRIHGVGSVVSTFIMENTIVSLLPFLILE